MGSLEKIQCKKIIDEIKLKRELEHTSCNYKTIKQEISTNISRIKENQQNFELKRKKESSKIVSRVIDFYRTAARHIGVEIAEKEWGTLFRDQLTNVNSLNRNLAMVIVYANSQLHDMKGNLIEQMRGAESNVEKYREMVKRLSERKHQFEQVKDVLEEGKDDVDYGRRISYFEAEDKLLENVNAIALLTTMKEKDKEKVDFLERHVAFHRSAIFSAKRLAIVTDQICQTLDHLVDVYETIRPMDECLKGVYDGIGMLKGYTDHLQHTYENTFQTIQAIEGHDSNTEMLSQGTRQLDGLVGNMMDNLKNDFGHVSLEYKE